MKVIASLPAKIMLSGEYAVLKGSPALALTLPYYLHLTLSQSESASACGINIQSNLWSDPKYFTPDSLTLKASEDALLHAIGRSLTRRKLWHNVSWDLAITSEYPPSYGFGSSSALRLGLLFALDAIEQKSTQLTPGTVSKLAAEAYYDQLDFQTQGSGYDIFTQATGGFCLFQCDSSQVWPGHSKQVESSQLPVGLWAYVGGLGADTKSAVQSTGTWLSNENKWPTVISLQNALTEASLGQHGKPVIQAMAAVRKFFQQGPKSLLHLEAKLASIAGLDDTWSWKMTGAGGEDALLCYAPHHERPPADAVLQQAGWRAIPLHLSNENGLAKPKIRDLAC